MARRRPLAGTEYPASARMKRIGILCPSPPAGRPGLRLAQGSPQPDMAHLIFAAANTLQHHGTAIKAFVTQNCALRLLHDRPAPANSLQALDLVGEPCRIRTCDPLIKSHRDWCWSRFPQISLDYASI